MASQAPTRPTDVDVHAVGVGLALGWCGGHGGHAQVGSVQVLLGPLSVVCLVVQVRKNHGLLKLGKGAGNHVVVVGEGGGAPGEALESPTHPELLGLQILVAPLILVVIHEGAVRGVLQGPGGGQESKAEWGLPDNHHEASALVALDALWLGGGGG